MEVEKQVQEEVHGSGVREALRAKRLAFIALTHTSIVQVNTESLKSEGHKFT
jgi:hypothetical protein